MSTNKEQMQQNHSSIKLLFLRVCYRHKSKLRSFECFPSFKELIDEITNIYPQIKSKLLIKTSTSSTSSANHNKNDDDTKPEQEKINNKNNNKNKSFEWRLQTNDCDWIENEQDWNTFIKYLKNKNLKLPSNTDTKPNPNSNSNPIHLTLHVIIDNQQNNNYNPELPSFQKCYKNPLTLIYQRPPPPPYKPHQAPPTSPPPSYYPPTSYPAYPPQSHAIYPPNPYTNAPYYSYPPQPHYPLQPPQISMPTPTNNTSTPTTTNNGVKRPLDVNVNGNGMNAEPAIKKRRLNTTAPAPIQVPPIAPVVGNNIQPMPSAPPPSDLLDANPYGIVHMNGYVWCDACNRWFEIHCFDSHLQGKKHKKNIEAFSFRKVLKHWQKIRTKVVDDVTKCNIHELSMDNNLWYAQICLSCLSEVHYSSWHQHVTGQVHQNNFAKCPRTVTVQRQMAPGNEGNTEIPTLFSEKYFIQISNYVPGSKILVLGEQDFSYSLAVCSILQSGDNLVGTSYLGAFDPNCKEPEEHPADDGIRANYFRVTLPSHNGQLQQNLHLLAQYRARTAHSIDGTKLLECLTNATPKVYAGPFDIIVFPFPRASLKRGLDFRNSTLIQGFFSEIRKHRAQLLYPLSQIQMIVLDNQFKEWDVANIAKENGWTLKWRCCINFSSLPQYQPRELSGKAWNPKTARLLVFLWDNEFDKRVEVKLDALNEINDLALLPDEAMKVTNKAKILDAYHAQGIRQYQDPSLTRLAAPPSSLQR